MSDCCSTSDTTPPFPKKHRCPLDGKEYSQVSTSTIKHHIKAPWSWQAKDQGYYFCSDPDCPVVYFGEDNSVIEQDSVRTRIGTKEKPAEALVCYCYGVTRQEAENTPLIRQFVIAETKRQQCACEARNPSGKCCLSDFPGKQTGSNDNCC